MSFFAVEKKKLSKVWTHPNADRLSLASVEGMTFQFVVGKDEYKEGDEVVYFPIDSILPNTLIEFFGISNHLSGAQRNRVKTAKLRGEISQGFVAKIDAVLNYWHSVCPVPGTEEKDTKETLPNDLTQMLGVTKYDPPILFAGKGANLTPLAGFVSSYDIEGCDRFPTVVELMMDKDVWISEKMEGTNFGISIDSGGTIRVNQHNNTVTPIEGSEDKHTFLEVADKHELDIVLRKLQTSDFPGKNILIRAELCGPSIQKNLYKFKDHKIFVFELEVNGKPLDVASMTNALFGEERIEFAPTIFKGKLRDFLNGKTVQEASNGKSLVNKDALREGIVIKPMLEEMAEWPKIKSDGTTVIERGRLVIKQRSPEYLAKEKD